MSRALFSKKLPCSGSEIGDRVRMGSQIWDNWIQQIVAEWNEKEVRSYVSSKVCPLKREEIFLKANKCINYSLSKFHKPHREAVL